MRRVVGFYEQVLQSLEGRRFAYVTFDDGTLELMAPLRRHEEPKQLFTRAIQAIAEQWNVPLKSVGSMTIKRRAVRGGESRYVFLDQERAPLFSIA